MPPTPCGLIHLRASGTSLVLDCSALPCVVHWGRDLGELAEQDLVELVRSLAAPQVSNTMDGPVPLALLPEASGGWAGTPGLALHRDGVAVSTRLTVLDVERTDAVGDDAATTRLVVRAEDALEQVGVEIEVELTGSGLLRQRATLTNLDVRPLQVDAVTLALPVPDLAREVLDLTGRHLRERSPQRHAFTLGTHLREGRRGRTGTDASLVLAAGEPGFGFRSGQVWAVHVGWSGNHRALAEALPDGRRVVAGGELLLPGEVRLAQGATYSSPWLYASHGNGLDEMSGRFHAFLRSRSSHPRGPRPVTLNTWEAVYFDHDLERLSRLADLGARVGAERFVLDDGWFRGRRDDHAGLGDWYVDEDVWPQGLRPLVEHVHGLGLQFGLWVEPEMINEDSDLARAHPDWILRPAGRMPPASRHQQVIDLSHPDAHAYLLERLDALVFENDVDYLKWDHNRDLVDAVSTTTGGARVHEQTLGLYALLDELKARHPGLEVESCSSGGGRVDLGVLERTDRVWASDCIDPLERQQIQRWTALVLPPELVGSHIGSPTAHTTARTHPLDVRAGTAVLCHLGIEWDLAEADEQELDRLAEWIATHRAVRELAHSGTVVHDDHPDPAVQVSGVVATDRSQAVYSLAQLTTSVHSPTGMMRLPGLDPDATYRVAPLAPGDDITGPGMSPLLWWEDGAVLPGRVLVEVGLRAPTLYPERLVLVRATRVEP